MRYDLTDDIYINVYELDSLYGGPEEGDWWYDTGWPVVSLKVAASDHAVTLQDVVAGLREVYPDNGNRRSTVYRQVPDKGPDYAIRIEGHPAKKWPEERPRYE